MRISSISGPVGATSLRKATGETITVAGQVGNKGGSSAQARALILVSQFGTVASGALVTIPANSGPKAVRVDWAVSNIPTGSYDAWGVILGNEGGTSVLHKTLPFTLEVAASAPVRPTPKFNVGNWVNSNIPIVAKGPSLVSKRQWAPAFGSQPGFWQYELQYWPLIRQGGIVKQFAGSMSPLGSPRIIARNAGAAMLNTGIRIGDYVGFGNGGRGIAVEDIDARLFRAAIWYNYPATFTRHEGGLSLIAKPTWVERTVADAPLLV